MRHMSLSLILGFGLGSPGLALAEDPPAEVTAEELLRATDDVARGDESVVVMEMYVKTKRYERTMKMKAWAKGTEKSLIRILEPAKDAGITTLKVDDNLWNYLPKVDRTMKIPSGMMGNSWMGSHVTNDDLVRENRLSEDFTWSFKNKPNAQGEGNYVLELVPKPDTAVVWGRIVVEVTPDKIPVEIGYYDEKGEKVRTMTWTEVKEMDGRRMPTVMTIIPADKPGEFTRMTYQEMDFDADIPPDMFTRQALQR